MACTSERQRCTPGRTAHAEDRTASVPPPLRTFTVGPGFSPGQPAAGCGRVADCHRRFGIAPTPEHAERDTCGHRNAAGRPSSCDVRRRCLGSCAGTQSFHERGGQPTPVHAVPLTLQVDGRLPEPEREKWKRRATSPCAATGTPEVQMYVSPERLSVAWGADSTHEVIRPPTAAGKRSSTRQSWSVPAELAT